VADLSQDALAYRLQDELVLSLVTPKF